jgi:hypothetical protein
VRAGTTPLEAAAVGLPVLALADVPEDSPAHVFQTGSPGLAGIPVSSTAEQFAVTVRRLLDPDLRRRQGDEVRAAVLGAHDGPGWRASLEAVYERARSLPAIDVDDLGDSPTDDRYGAMMLSAVFTEDASPDPQRLAGPLGELFDAQLEADLLAVSSRSTAEPFRVRVAPGWEEHEEWTGRLLELSSTHPRLAVSLPFLRGDDFQGTRTEATLVRLLEGIGRTPADCGEVSVEVSRPHQPGPGLPDDAPFTGELLDWLARLMASPLWTPAGTDPGQSAQGARTVLAHA